MNIRLSGSGPMPPRMPKMSLHEQRRLDEPAIEEMRQVVEVADVVALELEPRAVPLPQLHQDALHVLERVAEDEIVGGDEVRLFPVVFPLAVARRHREQSRNSSSPCCTSTAPAWCANGAARRCSTVMLVPPPVVMLMTASVACLMRGRNCMNTSGSGVGRPSLGSRACKCSTEAPASAASIACVAMSFGVKGSASDMVGVWMPPVTAQVMMTLSAMRQL